MAFSKTTFTRDLEKFTLRDLLQAQEVIEKEIQSKRDETRLNLQKEINELALKNGFAGGVAELFGTKTRGKSGRKSYADSPVKYRDPDNPEHVWRGGRGRMPRWMQDRIRNGSKQEDFAV